MAIEHYALLFRERVTKYGDRTAARYRADGVWRDISWSALGEMVEATARALVELGVPEGGTVGIFSHNRPEWTVVDVGALTARAVPVPIYPTNTAKQAEYIVNDAETAVLFVGGPEQLAKAREIDTAGRPLTLVSLYPTTEPGVLPFEEFLALGRRSTRGAEIEARLSRAGAEDLLTLIYTSGTTGEPKGVMLAHSAIIECARIHDLRLGDTGDDDVSMCFLPLSHVFERCWTYYVFHKGMINCYLDDPTQVVEALQQTHPTIMCAVPRFYEKVYAAVLSRVQGAPPLRRALFNWAVGVGRRAGAYRKDLLPMPPGLRLSHAVADALVLKKLRGIVGGRIKYFPCAGAPLSREIEEFFWACGIFIRYGYGLTETSATVSCHEDHHFRFGTVGRVMPGVEARTGENDEIQVRGKTVMKGYYKKPAATAEAFVDGWFRTGDAGTVDADGYIVITDRIKDLIKTSGGKYIAPVMIESSLGSDPLIEQVAVIGDERRFVSALLVPSFLALEPWAKEHGLPTTSREELIHRPEVVALYQSRIDEHNKPLARYEQVRKFTLLAREFTVEGGEITPTLKVKRKKVAEKYRDVIDAMYA
ncbi:MAG: long-chain fatty acid--CoA ligase [Acidobacteria bacterium]|nr:long-chain fatty acid--CoA ligase [Acidobacteriota bacterium]